MRKLNKFEEVRNKLQMILEILNCMPLEHGGANDVFAVTAKEMDNFLAEVTMQ
ncbi:hypothetical protein HMPREF0518_1680 [Lactobacillus helveticus DSM 20075 = CGMCC 1.1877]|uniref:hypothetical protein n=1 Tax=Lactobacillus helveticus TaxID=1587 RepID=UPI0001B8573E|nr:hypothetical protein [Lactobacillus helveticus]EEW67353.1 hypothetical protein HMPREF0518_1680 [Lactobacillus helveticus DSM 20075 = CGMCC 1.1877]KRL39235.1 hypothetical protein FC11_GL000372 [Lactobacillus helveticus DSM 20075 = CGMCC 1.1877]